MQGQALRDDMMVFINSMKSERAGLPVSQLMRPYSVTATRSSRRFFCQQSSVPSLQTGFSLP